MNDLNDIPREDLILMLREAAFYTDGKDLNGANGYSLDTDHDTVIKDVLYRGQKLYPTPDEAILAHWNHFYNNRSKP